MRLDDIDFNHEYRSGRDDLIADLYYPALARCSEYFRAVGYFSSSVFELLGKPLGDFVSRNGKIRLITSVELSENDITAIKEGMSKQKVAEASILREVNENIEKFAGKGTALLAYLLEIGSLEIRIALPDLGSGIYHEKVGIFIDKDRYVTFSGSANESRSGLSVNYECVDVYTSWKEPARAKAKLKHFESLWSNTAEGVTTFSFPEAAQKEIIRIAKRTNPELFPESGLDAPPQYSDKWRHQDKAIEIFLEKKKGILEMATGTGKTRTALKICEHLITNGKVKTVLISADGNDLLDQWYKQVLELTRKLPNRFSVFRHYGPNHEREKISIDSSNKILLASRQALPIAMKSSGNNSLKDTFLIHDEVHRLGSPANRTNLRGLSRNIPYRLGLSATPEREYDQDGNDFIEKHIGETIFQFDLENAIQRGILCPFNYFPLSYTPNQEDRDKLKKVHSMIAARKHAGNPMSKEEIWIEIARVYKTSEAKFEPFLRFIQQNQGVLKRCIIFVETKEYGEKVLEIVHQYRHDFHTYFAEDESDVLRRFARGELECLLTCHRLSEGIDIRSINSVVLFSSARARLESIQRIGRCLRIHDEDPHKRANVVDFIRNDHTSETNPDIERREWLSKLAEIEYED